jgi:hypothetical protein
MFGYLTLFTGLALSTIAAWFAIEGIMAIFAGLPIYAMIMGIVIEGGKIVGVTWIYRHWAEKTTLKFVMIPFVIIMMLLTSMGIFGLLSKAHLEQTAPVTNNTAKIERLDLRVAREQTEIADAELVIDQLDDTIRVLVDAKIISHPTRGSKVVRIAQQPQRDALKQIINESMDSIDEYEDTKLSLNQELNELELEVGPVKYIAAIIYEDPNSQIDEAVRIVIIAFIFVFDPMAILLLMAGNYTLMGRVGAAPTTSAPPKKKKIVPNAKMEFVPAEVIAEVVAEVIDEKLPPMPTPPPDRLLKEGEIPSKAKSIEIPAEPHGHGIHSPQFYKDK